MHILLVQFFTDPTPDFDELARRYRSWGHTTWVSSCDPQGNLVWNDGSKTIAFQRGPSKVPAWVDTIPAMRMVHHRYAYLAFILRVRRFLKESRADIVQINRPMYASFLALAMPRHMRFLLDVRQIGEWDRPTPLGLFKNWRAVMRSKIGARFLYERGLFASVPAARRVLGNNWKRWGSVTPVGVHEQFLEYTPATPARKESHEAVRFVYVGTITKLRRLELLFEAIQRVHKTNARFQVSMIGVDRANGHYHRLVDAMGLSQVITMLPPVPYERVPDIVWKHDVALAYVADVADWRYQPTLKILEYRALGIPILASDNEPNREIVNPEENGILVQNTSMDIAVAMLRFIQDRDFLFRCTSSSLATRGGRTWTDAARIHMDEVYIG